MQCPCLFNQLLAQSQHHPDLLSPCPFQQMKLTVYTSFIPNPVLFDWRGDAGLMVGPYDLGRLFQP